MNKTKVGFLNFLILFFVFLGIFTAVNVSAHQASDMNLSFNINSQELNVSITHGVSDPQAHYIYVVTISKNNEIYASYDYTSQPTSSSFTYTYVVNATIGDEIEVFADCNYGGSLTKQITVTSGVSSTDDSSNLIHDITYYPILGIPFIVYLGIFTLFMFILTAALPLLNKWGKTKINVKWHIRLAYIAILLGIIHGILGFLLYV